MKVTVLEILPQQMQLAKCALELQINYMTPFLSLIIPKSSYPLTSCRLICETENYRHMLTKKTARVEVVTVTVPVARPEEQYSVPKTRRF